MTKTTLQIVILLLSLSLSAAEKKHLFILSGQSNMTGGLEKGFKDKVEKEFGVNNVVVVKSMKSGRGLRFWVKDYQYGDEKLTAKKNASNGEEYPKLLKTAKDGLNKERFDTVSFIWMQGESDAGRKELCSVYALNFKKLYNQLKKDLELEKLFA